jgi:hypothetical protein
LNGFLFFQRYAWKFRQEDERSIRQVHRQLPVLPNELQDARQVVRLKGENARGPALQGTQELFQSGPSEPR